MAPSNEYALTVTLKPKLFLQSIEKQYDTIRDELQLFKTKLNLQITAVVELTKSYNCHLHAIIQFEECPKKSIPRIVYDYFRTNKNIGFIYLRDIDNFEVWLQYCKKHIWSTNKVLFCRSAIMFDDFKYINPFDHLEPAAHGLRPGPINAPPEIQI